MKAFVVAIADINHQPGARRHEHIEAPIADLFVSSSRVPADAPVALDLWLESVQEGILATGTATTAWVGECRRCLGRASGTLVVDYRELFESEPVEGESYPLRHEQVDLEPLAREAVILALPQAPLCREDCRGLCAGCGADLNEGPCSCEPERDDRWAALDVLRTQLED